MKEDGKKLTVVVYQAEGNTLVWDGKELRSSESMTDYKAPQTESWVRMKTKAGVTGWAKLPAKDSKELDYEWCG